MTQASNLTLLLAMASAFLFAALLVFAFGRFANEFLERHHKQYEKEQKRLGTKPAALINLMKMVLAEEGRRFRSLNSMHQRFRRQVVQAAYRTTATEYLGQTLFEGLAIFVVGVSACLILFGPLSLLIPTIIALAWVYIIRPSLVATDAEGRSRAIYRRIPYALDLGVLVLQAGGTLRDALEIIADGDDPFAVEVATALREIDAGATQKQALRNMSDRVGLEALESIVLAVVRGIETGAPMARTLATQAELFRERRLQELEKLAVEAPTKMTFPNMLVMLSVLIIIIGPVLVKISQSGLL